MAFLFSEKKNLLWLNASLAAESRTLQQMAQNWFQPFWLIAFLSFQWKSGENLFTLKCFKLCQYYFSLFYQNWSRLCNGKVMVNGWQLDTSFGTTPSSPDRQDGKKRQCVKKTFKGDAKEVQMTPKASKWVIDKNSVPVLRRDVSVSSSFGFCGGQYFRPMAPGCLDRWTAVGWTDPTKRCLNN